MIFLSYFTGNQDAKDVLFSFQILKILKWKWRTSLVSSLYILGFGFSCFQDEIKSVGNAKKINVYWWNERVFFVFKKLKSNEATELEMQLSLSFSLLWA